MTVVNGYEQSDAEKKLNILNLPSLADEAKKIIPTGGYGYIVGGSEDEWTLAENTKAFNHAQIVPKALSNIDSPDLSTNFLGIDLKTPIMMAPTAAQGLAHSQGEKDTARGVAAVGGLMAQSTYSSTSIADTAAAGNGAPQLFQLYMSKDWDFNKSLLDEAKKAGVKGIILTVDATVDGYREEDIINNFQFPIPMPNLESIQPVTVKAKELARFMPLLLKRSVKTMFVELPNTPICQSSSKGFSLLKMLCAQLVPVQPRFMFPTMAAVS